MATESSPAAAPAVANSPITEQREQSKQPNPDTTASDAIAALQAQVDKLTRQLEEQRVEHAQQLSDLHVSKMLTEARTSKPASGLTSGQLDSARDRAIIQAGGLSKFLQIDPAKRIAAFGADVTEFTLEEVREHFGATSNSVKANALSRGNPAKYRRMRTVAKELGIL
jgi:hypothetical protein